MRIRTYHIILALWNSANTLLYNAYSLDFLKLVCYVDCGDLERSTVLVPWLSESWSFYNASSWKRWYYWTCLHAGEHHIICYHLFWTIICFSLVLELVLPILFLIFGLCIQMYAPTTLVPARDFWTLRYTTTMEDGSLVVRMNLNVFFTLV